MREYSSDAIKLVLERLEKNVKRLTDCESSGMWRFAGYVISGDRAMSQRVANVYQGMIPVSYTHLLTKLRLLEKLLKINMQAVDLWG